ncbi:MAG: Membrane-bound acyltransferase YfiQ, involved in biofilm formation [Mucilaginibacter sp.]|uniref:acyltransferase family protein n=1 Tax=Mucilaginibacter sp. TaxID=1882438 RepID=UPI002635526B|nr:acyltransferase [Mucilaginibacter sp.]MDB5005328.1 Membrane-bound acyltransferase YfiQ, involved in biofilm formation [Mucilaginibacter sp.]
MQNLVNEVPAKKNYEFIDAIRAIAMISIVMEHSFSFNAEQYNPTDSLSIITLATVLQYIKFGTIAFFLLAGFLIGEKFTTYTPLQYLKRRVDNTILPWVFWSLFFLGTIVLNDVVSAYQFNHGQFEPNYTARFFNYFKVIYLYSNYWFIPNFLICIGILLLFQRYLYSYWLGAGLLLFTVLYMFNIYNEWIEPRHSTAIFGFVFFLWLGAQFNRHLAAFEKWLNKTSIWLWLFLSIITGLIGIKEILYLKAQNSVDPYNTLRLSNIVYSMCFFFFLLKIKNFKFVNFIKPRETTYGIYLIHYILVAMLLPMIFPSLRFGIKGLSYGEVWAYMIARFLIAYIVTFIIVSLINKSRAKWLIGR